MAYSRDTDTSDRQVPGPLRGPSIRGDQPERREPTNRRDRSKHTPVEVKPVVHFARAGESCFTFAEGPFGRMDGLLHRLPDATTPRRLHRHIVLRNPETNDCESRQ